MRLGPADSFVWFGAGRLLFDSCRSLKESGFRVAVFSGKRHMDEVILEGGESLFQALQSAGIPAFVSEDINSDPRLRDHVSTGSTLGVAMGPAWIFRSPVCDLFGERFVNFMGIDLPRYRGGAHYTWQILRGDKQGSCNLQLINPVVDSGGVVFSRRYRMPDDARIPQDYFDKAGSIEREFLGEFLDLVQQGHDFKVEAIEEGRSEYYPYLGTIVQGIIDWSWEAEEICRFICAFDDPYPGAGSRIEGAEVRLKDAIVDESAGPFHPFMSGLIFRIGEGRVWIAARGGALVVKRVINENGEDITRSLRAGWRFHSPAEALDEARAYRAIYDANGLRRAPEMLAGKAYDR